MNKEKLNYLFTPAAIISNFVPLVVILNGKEDTEELNFEYKMWNMLTPMYNEEDDNEELLSGLINEMSEEHECEEHTYIYGSSHGGYSAILHGIICKVNTLYVHEPRLSLAETKHLCTFLNSKDFFPLIYICEDEETEETSYFVNECKKHGVEVHLDFSPDTKESEEHMLKEVLNMLERMTP